MVICLSTILWWIKGLKINDSLHVRLLRMAFFVTPFPQNHHFLFASGGPVSSSVHSSLWQHAITVSHQFWNPTLLFLSLPFSCNVSLGLLLRLRPFGIHVWISFWCSSAFIMMIWPINSRHLLRRICTPISSFVTLMGQYSIFASNICEGTHSAPFPHSIIKVTIGLPTILTCFLWPFCL